MSLNPGDHVHPGGYRQRNGTRIPPGGATVMTTASALRSRTEILAHYEYVRREWSSTGEEFYRGVESALAWALGETRKAPASGSYTLPAPPDHRAVYAEEALARDAIYHRDRGRGIPDIDRSYAVGVEHTLMWVRADPHTPAP